MAVHIFAPSKLDVFYLCAYNKCVKITFDPTKNSANIAKHGVSLTIAADLEWDSAMTWADGRRDYGEARLYCVIFTDRGNTRRIISLRKANEREVRRYVSEN